jgi:hypothetical protein
MKLDIGRARGVGDPREGHIPTVGIIRICRVRVVPIEEHNIAIVSSIAIIVEDNQRGTIDLSACLCEVS